MSMFRLHWKQGEKVRLSGACQASTPEGQPRSEGWRTRQDITGTLGEKRWKWRSRLVARCSSVDRRNCRRRIVRHVGLRLDTICVRAACAVSQSVVPSSSRGNMNERLEYVWVAFRKGLGEARRSFHRGIGIIRPLGFLQARLRREDQASGRQMRVVDVDSKSQWKRAQRIEWEAAHPRVLVGSSRQVGIRISWRPYSAGTSSALRRKVDSMNLDIETQPLLSSETSTWHIVRAFLGG
jgi:hypothetical protein